jgi:hypothetical protein
MLALVARGGAPEESANEKERLRHAGKSADRPIGNGLAEEALDAGERLAGGGLYVSDGLKVGE